MECRIQNWNWNRRKRKKKLENKQNGILFDFSSFCFPQICLFENWNNVIFLYYYSILAIIADKRYSFLLIRFANCISHKVIYKSKLWENMRWAMGDGRIYRFDQQNSGTKQTLISFLNQTLSSYHSFVFLSAFEIENMISEWCLESEKQMQKKKKKKECRSRIVG